MVGVVGGSRLLLGGERVRLRASVNSGALSVNGRASVVDSDDLSVTHVVAAQASVKE